MSDDTIVYWAFEISGGDSMRTQRAVIVAESVEDAVKRWRHLHRELKHDEYAGLPDYAKAELVSERMTPQHIKRLHRVYRAGDNP